MPFFVTVPNSRTGEAFVRGVAIVVSDEETNYATPAPLWCDTVSDVLNWLRDAVFDLPNPVTRSDVLRVLESWRKP